MGVLGGRGGFDHFAFGAFLLCVVTGSSDGDENGKYLFRHRLMKPTVREYDAFCNDYSIPNYYISNGTHEDQATWVIFLEGGGLCMNKANCTKRYVDETVLMSSSRYGVRCVDGETYTNRTFPDRVEGYDILSSDRNHDSPFAAARRVLVPYCSSDLWLGRSMVDGEARKAALNSYDKPGCQSYARAENFTFRGTAILRALIMELKSSWGLCRAETVLIAGSSAGGIGALNAAAWIRSFLQDARVGCDSGARVAVLGDSQWFIDFHGALRKQMSKWATESFGLDRALPGNISDFDGAPNFCTSPANATTPYPCCLSTRCVLEECRKGELENIAMFAAFSVSDGYIPGYFELPPLANVSPNTRAVAEVVRVMTEYAGSVNYSLTSLRSGQAKLSYFVPACLHHVFLATSSLWNTDGVLGRLMGNIYRQAGSRFIR